MKRDVKLIHLSDDEFVQTLLGSISQIFGFAVGIDNNSNMFFDKTMNTCTHCNQVISTEKGAKDCHNFTHSLAKKAKEKGCALYGICPCGLAEIVLPIEVMGKYAGTVICGQIFLEEPKKKNCERIIKKYNLYSKEYYENIKKVKVISKEKLEKAVKEIEDLCKTISKVLCKNFILEELTKREAFLREVNTIITSNSNLSTIFRKISEELAGIFKVQRVLVINISNDCIEIEEDYKVDKKLQIEAFTNEQYYNLFKQIKRILDKKEPAVIKSDDFLSIDTDKSILKYCTKSGLHNLTGFIIQKDKEKSRMILLCSYKKERKWLDDELDFLSIVSEQISSELKHVGLHNIVSSREKMAETILDNIPFFSWFKDLSGKYILSNDKTYFFGGQAYPNDIVDSTDYEKLIQNNKNIFDEGDDFIISTGNVYVTERLLTIKKQKRWLEIIKTPIKNKNGEICAISGHARDITGQKVQTTRL